jgi:hypothetical protein
LLCQRTPALQSKDAAAPIRSFLLSSSPLSPYLDLSEFVFFLQALHIESVDPCDRPAVGFSMVLLDFIFILIVFGFLFFPTDANLGLLYVCL